MRTPTDLLQAANTAAADSIRLRRAGHPELARVRHNDARALRDLARYEMRAL